MIFSSEGVDELLMGASSVIQVAAIAVAHDYINRERVKQRSGQSPAQRLRRMSIPEVFNSMGPRIFRRAFRMTLDSFLASTFDFVTPYSHR